jgi:hypothetical protein
MVETLVVIGVVIFFSAIFLAIWDCNTQDEWVPNDEIELMDDYE